MQGIDRIVIVGGGMAGANAAFALRDRGFAGEITIVGEEQAPPYERPKLSKEYLRSEKPFEKALVRPVADYADQQIDLLTGRRALAVAQDRRELTLDDGSAVHYDRLLIATGSAARRLEIPGAALDGVLYLRDVGDSDAIRARAASAEAVVVIGGGWIGSEVAASLRQLGHQVTLVSSHPRPLEHVLGPEVAEIYARVHRANGVKLVHGNAMKLTGRGSVTGVTLGDGTTLPAELVVGGIGAVPRIELARTAGLEIDGGWIKVDAELRTSDPSIYAAGDVTAAWNPRYGRSIHVEHWDNAKRQGRTAAANMIGAGLAYDRVPYFYSDQFDLGMEYRGLAPTWDRVVIRGDPAAREFHAFWLAGGRVLAAMNVNLWDDGDRLQEIVDLGEPIDVERLADPRVPLAPAA